LSTNKAVQAIAIKICAAMHRLYATFRVDDERYICRSGD
jgi:hypothetical protein